MKIHHNTAKKAKTHGITLSIVENEIVASKGGVTLASGLIGNKVLDEAIAKLEGPSIKDASKKQVAKIKGERKAAKKKARKAKKARVSVEGMDDEDFDEDGEPDPEDEGRSIIKRKYKTRYKPFKMTNGDEIAQEVRKHVMFKDEHTKKLVMDHGKFLRFAKANGCWDPAYAKLNHGMQRMNVVNRLRGKIRRDKHDIVWS